MMHRTKRLSPAAPRAMIWLVALTLAFGCLPVVARAQGLQAPQRNSDLPSRSATPPFFLVDTSRFLNDDGRPGVRVTVSIPYHQLHFARTGDEGFETVFDVSEIFYGGKKKQMAGDVWRHRVKVRRYRATRSQRRRFSDTQEFLLPPGKYNLVVRVRSFGTQSGSELTRPIVIEKVETEALALTGLELGICADSLGAAVSIAEAGFKMSWSRSFGEPLPHACARAELFDPRTGDARRVDLLLEVLADDHVLEEVANELVAQDSRTIFALDMPLERLGPGTYTLRLTATAGGRESVVSRDFEIDASRIDLRRNYEQMLRLVELYLDEDVRDQLGDVPVEERRARWNAFWVGLDPEPEVVGNRLLDEFFRRIRVSATRFGRLGASGWETDRGKVYVRYGEPEDVETIPRGFNTPAYEIWRYVERNLTFVFADTSSFGDFVLVQPTPAPF